MGSVGAGSGVAVSVGREVGVNVASTCFSRVGCLVGRATRVATAVAVLGAVAVGLTVGVLVGVGVGGGWLLHPIRDADVAARTLTSKTNKVAETTPDGLSRAVWLGLSNLSSSC